MLTAAQATPAAEGIVEPPKLPPGAVCRLTNLSHLGVFGGIAPNNKTFASVDTLYDAATGEVRRFLEPLIQALPELFPAGIQDGFQLSGHLPESEKMPGIRLRQLRVQQRVYTLRPSFVMSYMTGTVDELETASSKGADWGYCLRCRSAVSWSMDPITRLEFNNGRVGRDHWPNAMSILISGGGMPMGRLIGATDKIGARPNDRPLDPHDLLATIYRYLGIDHKLHINDPFGRPIALTHGEPIAELL